MNRQTKALLKEGKSLKFNHGVDFAHLSGRERSTHPEFTILLRPQAGRQGVDSHKEREKARKRPYNPLRVEQHVFVASREALLSRANNK